MRDSNEWMNGKDDRDVSRDVGLLYYCADLEVDVPEDSCSTFVVIIVPAAIFLTFLLVPHKCANWSQKVRGLDTDLVAY